MSEQRRRTCGPWTKQPATGMLISSPPHGGISWSPENRDSSSLPTAATQQPLTPRGGAQQAQLHRNSASLITAGKNDPLRRSTRVHHGGAAVAQGRTGIGGGAVQPIHLSASIKASAAGNAMMVAAANTILALSTGNPSDLAGDTELEAVMSCKYTEHFDELLLHMPRPNLRGVMLVWVRLTQERSLKMGLTTYNRMLDRVADLKEELVFTIYDHMCDAARRDESVKPNLETFLCMVRACERWSDYNRAFQIYAQMRNDYEVFPDLPLYNTLIGYCAPTKDEAMAGQIIEEMRARGVEPDVHTYNGLMNVFRESASTLDTLDEIQKRKLKPNRRTYNTLMKACLASGDYDRHHSLFEEMKREAIAPDVVSYNLLFAACLERIDYIVGEGAFSHLQRTKEQKDIGLRSIAHVGLHLLQEMESVRVLPNSFTFLKLLAILARSAEPRIFDVLQQMRHARDEQCQLVPSDKERMSTQPLLLVDSKLPPFALLQEMLDAAAARALTAAGAEGGDKLGDYGVAMTPEAYGYVFDGAARLQLPLQAYRVFEEMTTIDNVAPTRDTYIKLLRCCAIKGDKNKATALFHDAKFHRITYDVHLYNAYLAVLAEKCDPLIFDVFLDLKEDRERLSVKPNEESYLLMLRALGKTQNIDHAMRLYEELRDPSSIVPLSPTVYATLIDICATKRDRRKAADLILDMRARGYDPSADIFARFMNVFVEANDPQLMEVFEELKKNGPQPNLEVYKTVLRYYAKNDNEAIHALFKELKEKPNIEPDLEAYNTMLGFVAKKGTTPQLAFRLLDEVKGRGMQANIDTYNALLSCFAPTGSDFIFKIFEEMNECHIVPNDESFATLLRHHAGRMTLQKCLDKGIVSINPLE